MGNALDRRVGLRVVEGAEQRAEGCALAEYTYEEGGSIEQAGFGLVGEDESFTEALLRHGFRLEPDFEVGQFDSPVGARVYARTAGRREDYLVLTIFPLRPGPLIYVPSLPRLLHLLADLRSIVGLPTRACT